MSQYEKAKLNTITIGDLRKFLDLDGLPNDTPIGLIGSESTQVESIFFSGHTMVEDAPDGTKILLLVDFCPSTPLLEMNEDGNLVDIP